MQKTLTTEHSMPWDLLLLEKRKQIQAYYMKKMAKHPNMSAKRLMDLCGKKFDLKFEIEG